MGARTVGRIAMSLNSKIIILSLLILGAVPAYFLYKRSNQPLPKLVVPREEVTLTILPGWDLRDIADYLVKQGIASSTKGVYKITGKPAVPFTVPKGEVKPEDSFRKFDHYNYEGYLAPETIRFFKGATTDEVIKRFFEQQLMEVTEEMRVEAVKRGITWHETLTMASIVEREARGEKDRRLVADILWRRLKIGMALQVDSSVHYISGRSGDVFTTSKERDSKSLWNTYEYPGLPPGPIAMPSLQSINATLWPEQNTSLYFLTDLDGRMHYAATLDDHNFNRSRYLR